MGVGHRGTGKQMGHQESMMTGAGFPRVMPITKVYFLSMTVKLLFSRCLNASGSSAFMNDKDGPQEPQTSY